MTLYYINPSRKVAIENNIFYCITHDNGLTGELARDVDREELRQILSDPDRQTADVEY